MANPMKIRAKVKEDVADVRILMSHVMETGQRKNQAGETIPAHFIQTVTCTCGDRVVLSAQWGPAVSANPYIAFKFRGCKPGDVVRVTWTDNAGDSRTDEVAAS